MNSPPSQPVERRGASGSPDGPSSLVFFGGIVVAIALLGAGALAIWGPEKDTSSMAPKFATDPPPAESLPSLPPDPVPSETIAPPADPPPEAAPADTASKKAKKGKGGKGVKKR